ncbi:hypothetical protein FRC08_010519 [Ceratobasidium sp. 394]|nr:hypothetical protein FRC08_010519 [Ceratobasidium sp. 394]
MAEDENDPDLLTPPPSSASGPSLSNFPLLLLLQTEGAGSSTATSRPAPQAGNLSELDAWIGPGSTFGNVDEFGCVTEGEEPGEEDEPLEYVDL